jgi:hypothetical protein
VSLLSSELVGDTLAFLKRQWEAGDLADCVAAAKGHPTLAKFLEEWKDQPGKHYSVRDVDTLCNDEVLNDIHATAARTIVNSLPAAIREAVYVYNSYLGSVARPVLNFHEYPLELCRNGKHEPFQSDPNLLNLYADVRAFCSERALPSTLNYLLPQPVFRGEDIYRRGVNGRSPIERARQYVILEFSFCEAYARERVLEITNYKRMRTVLEGLFEEASRGTRAFRWCTFPRDYSHSKEYATFLLRAALLWNHIFEEVRLRANCFVPERIYDIVTDWGKSCCHAENGYCEVCTWFSKGALLWKRGDARPDPEALSLLDLDSPQGTQASDLIGVIM